jgi:hypothetical protein
MQVYKANSSLYLYLPLIMTYIALCASIMLKGHPRYAFVYNQPCYSKCSKARVIVPILEYSQVNER